MKNFSWLFILTLLFTNLGFAQPVPSTTDIDDISIEDELGFDDLFSELLEEEALLEEEVTEEPVAEEAVTEEITSEPEAVAPEVTTEDPLSESETEASEANFTNDEIEAIIPVNVTEFSTTEDGTLISGEIQLPTEVAEEFFEAGATLMIVIAVIAVLLIVSFWKVFTKAGKPGWYSIIPLWNLIVMLDIGKKSRWWFLLLFVPIVNIFVNFMIMRGIAKSFGKGLGFTWGLFLLGFVFWPILAFGDSEYLGDDQPTARERIVTASAETDPLAPTSPGDFEAQPPQPTQPADPLTPPNNQPPQGMQ